MKYIFICLFLFSSCVSTKRMLHFNQAKRIESPKKKVSAKKAAEREVVAEFLYPESPEVKKALFEFQKTGKAAIIKKAGFIRFPYGEHEPVVFCSPVRLCDIELEPGEKVIDFASGDNLRWNFFLSVSGSEKNQQVHHLVVTPRELEIATNLLITTDRRSYNIKLVSKETDYYPRVKFYYPEDTFKRVSSAYEEVVRKEEEKKNSICFPKLVLEELSFNYELTDRKRARWKPTRVFDNGEKVYIKMPKTQEYPILLVRSNGSKDAELVNYRTKCNFFVVDKVFDEAILVSGEGKARKEVIIKRLDA